MTLYISCGLYSFMKNIKEIPEIKNSELWPIIEKHDDWEYFWHGTLKNGKSGVAFRSKEGGVISFEVKV